MTSEVQPFVHLRLHSAYSLLEGAVRPKELATLCRDLRMPAVAVTDTNNLFGVYEISDALAKNGVQPIVGVTLSVDHRVIDGALGAELLAAFKAYIEDPVTMLV